MNGLPEVDWDKVGGLLPAIVQHANSGAVLMLGYMNREALAATRASGKVTFWSRTKQRLWMKGESSGHVLEVRALALDCDCDTLLVLAIPHGPTCHLSTDTCFGELPPRPAVAGIAFLAQLEHIVAKRKIERPAGSYTAKLFDQGVRRMAQKVGEEALEVALAAVAQTEAELVGETADLLFHTWMLLAAKNIPVADVVLELQRRHDARNNA